MVGGYTINQQEEILKKKWDILIILDACRYDYFAEVASSYFDEKLKKAISPASNTHEWAKKVLEPYEWQDVVYISANPWINSKTAIAGLDLRGNFFKIYDAWLYDWDEEKNTVPPNVLTERTLKLFSEYSGLKFIVHYIQPHAPYLLDKRRSSPFPLKGGVIDSPKHSWIKKLAIFIIEQLIPRPLFRAYLRYRMKKGLPIGGPEFQAFAEYSLDRWRNLYRSNLEITLPEVTRLIESIDGQRVVITADHGELLGDRFWFGYKVGHPALVRYPQLIEVPWMEVVT